MISKRGLAAILTVAITSSAMMPAAAAETTAEQSDIAVQAPMSDEGVSETGDEIQEDTTAEVESAAEEDAAVPEADAQDFADANEENAGLVSENTSMQKNDTAVEDAG